MQKIRKGDQVVVLSGRDKGRKGAVLEVLGDGQVVVEGVNLAKRHTKPNTKYPRGGILEVTKPVPAGKVALVCPSCKQPTRIGYKLTDSGKERVCRKCNAPVGKK